MSYICAHCGKRHDDLPLDIAFAKPGAFLALSPRQQKSKCELNADFCVIGRKRFFIRGCLPIPIVDLGKPFIWGLWAEVSPDVFALYQKLYDLDGSKEMPRPGALSVESTPELRGMNQLPVLIHFGPRERRPVFELRPGNHWLCRDQRNGVTLHRVQEILHWLFPAKF